MASTSLEHRVEKLEKQLAHLQAELGSDSAKKGKDWRRTVGMFTGDDAMLSIFQTARKLREADRRKAHSASRKTGKPKR